LPAAVACVPPGELPAAKNAVCAAVPQGPPPPTISGAIPDVHARVPEAHGHTTMHVLFAVLTFTMFGIGSSFGCGGKIDVCTRAEQYLAACGSTRGRPECRVDAEAQCHAECLVDVQPTCSELYRQLSPDESTPLTRCYDSCARTFEKRD